MGSSTLDALSAYALPPLPSLALPPLPPINDPEYYEIVTTHASLRKSAHSNHELNPKVMLKDYEKLEHVGDALLGAVVAVILHDLFPMIGEGPASMLKGQLVSNAILAQVSERYGLPALLRTDPGAQYIVRKQVKAQASVFEAWVAGVYYTVLDSMAGEDEGSESESEDEDTDEDAEQGESETRFEGSVESESASEIDQDAIARPADQEVSDGVACKGQPVQEEDSSEAGKDAEKEDNARGRAAGRTVRFVEEVRVEVLEPTSPSSSSSGLPTPTTEAQDASSACNSTAKQHAPQGQQEHDDSEGDTPEDASSSDSTDSGDASDCPFARLLKEFKRVKARVNTAPSTSSHASADQASSPPLRMAASSDPRSPSPSPPTTSTTPSSLNQAAPGTIPAIPSSSSPSLVPNTKLPPPAPSVAPQNAIRLRWLAMCVLDDWLRPIFTPLALWAMDCLRAEQVRIRAARKPAQAVVDALDAKTKGCMAIVHNLVQAGEVAVPVYEVQQIEKREGEVSGYWKVVCKVTAKSGEVFTAESVRTAKKPAQNIATYRVLLQLGQVDDAEELAKCRSGSSTGASSEVRDVLEDGLVERQAGEVIDEALVGSAPAGDAEQA